MPDSSSQREKCVARLGRKPDRRTCNIHRISSFCRVHKLILAFYENIRVDCPAVPRSPEQPDRTKVEDRLDVQRVPRSHHLKIQFARFIFLSF